MLIGECVPLWSSSSALSVSGLSGGFHHVFSYQLTFPTTSSTMAHFKSFRGLPMPLVEVLSRRSKVLGSETWRMFGKARNFSTADLSALDARKGDRERVVILGSGWAGKHRT